MRSLYFEDFKAGDRFRSPGMTVTESQIIDFAMTFDSQPFHTDVEAARESIFGGLVASGIHTMALTFRLLLMSGILANNLGSPGFDEVRWTMPVKPGDTLRAEAEVLETTASKKRPDRGTVRFRYSSRNQRDEEVFHCIGIQILKRRQKG